MNTNTFPSICSTGSRRRSPGWNAKPSEVTTSGSLDSGEPEWKDGWRRSWGVEVGGWGWARYEGRRKEGSGVDAALLTLFVKIIKHFFSSSDFLFICVSWTSWSRSEISWMSAPWLAFYFRSSVKCTSVSCLNLQTCVFNLALAFPLLGALWEIRPPSWLDVLLPSFRRFGEIFFCFPSSAVDQEISGN